MHLSVRLRLTEGPRVPFDHNFLLGCAVYKHLRELSEEIVDPLHDSPHRSPYVLSEIHHVANKPAEAWFRLGTSSEAVAKAVGKALTPSTELHIRGTVFQVTGLDIQEPVVRPGEYVTLSPILLRDRVSGQSLIHDSPGYVDSLESAINQQVQNYTQKEGALKVVHFEHQAVRKRTIKGRTVLAQKGRMILDGEEEQLRLLVSHGIGASPALGFGMVVLNKGWHFD